MSARETDLALAAPRDNRRPVRATRAPAPVAQPVLIEAAGHTCVAWWHAPAAPAAPLAVVLASSWGDEEMAAYDDQRALACALADAGLGALRFEWPDTGDSSAATGSTTIADALAAFDAAAERALALSGHERLAFVGRRLGALLAAHAAAARADVDALVALMPVAGGRAFVREQPVLGPGALALRPGALLDPAELPVSLGGFALPVRRLEALSALRWPAAATTSVLEALLIQQPHVASRTAADALARMGMRVRERMHADPAATATPEVVRWLRERAVDATVLRGVAAIEGFGVADPANARTNAALAAARLDAATTAVLALARTEAPAWMRLRLRGVALRERVVRIDDRAGSALVGVLSERDRAIDEAVPREAVLLLSSGRDRRVGPHRLWVPWARQRAAAGDVVLRLDLAGSGDSAPCAPTEADDLARALAWLRRERGVAGCTVVGIGAGATRAWRAALEGLDVQRVIAIDPTRLRRPASRARRLVRPFGDELAHELASSAARGISLNLVLSQRDGASRSDLGLPRDSGVTISRIASAHPDFAGPADKAALYARLDALLPPPQAALASPALDAARDAARVPGPSFAAEALRAIARSSRAAT